MFYLALTVFPHFCNANLLNFVQNFTYHFSKLCAILNNVPNNYEVCLLIFFSIKSWNFFLTEWWGGGIDVNVSLRVAEKILLPTQHFKICNNLSDDIFKIYFFNYI